MYLFVFFHVNFNPNSRELPEALRFPLLIPNDVDRSSIPLPTVRGSLYEVDILDRECRAIYWKGIGNLLYFSVIRIFLHSTIMIFNCWSIFNLKVAINIVYCLYC